MSFNIAFDKNKNLEIMLYRNVKYKKDKFFIKPSFEIYIKPIGSFLLTFLNTNFENNNEFRKFICNFCFEQFYYKNHPQEKIDEVEFKGLELSLIKFKKELAKFKEEKNNFINIQKIFIENLQEKNEKESVQINLLIDNLFLDLYLNNYILTGISVNSYSLPYAFKSFDIFNILAIELKEFISNDRNKIKKCKNCGKFFIPKNLKQTKYCSNIFKNNKTCKQIGKEIAYKNSLKKDKLLQMYRKRYLSLASSVSHYGTKKAIERFNIYKKEGAVIKQKYIKKEISQKDFKKWIEKSYFE